MTPEEEEAKEFRLKQLLTAQEFLEESLKAGKMAKRVYAKAQVCIAHDLLVEHQRASRACEALRRCDPEYFQEEQRQDMAEDPRYRDLVVTLASALVALGLADGLDVPAATQALGHA